MAPKQPHPKTSTSKSHAADHPSQASMFSFAEPESPAPDALDYFTHNMLRVAEQGRALLQHTLSQNPVENGQGLTDQMHIGAAFAQWFGSMLQAPETMLSIQAGWWQDYANLLQYSTSRMLGGDAEPVIEPDAKDKRFKDEAWVDLPAFDFMKQFYLMTSKRLSQAARSAEGIDAQTARKVSFYTQQFIDALSPSNYLLTNPEALRATLESQGENLVRGMENLLEDIKTGRISMTDVEAFEVGKNIAYTPGNVVFRNDLMELIHYHPAGEKVHATPLLLIPAWINKFYIFDLKPANSLVKWLVEQGYSVFTISWVNPSEKHRDKNFDDYLMEGPLAALDAIRDITGQAKASILGYCLGGTLLSIFLSWLKAKGQEDRVASATFFTTMTDFSEAGDLSVFIDEEQIQTLERRMSDTGFLDGKAMATTFNMLRANDLIWHFVVNNYLLGKDPFPFDLLYWNSDATRMPARMHSFYLRSMYQQNLLAKPKGITVAGVPIDLRSITTPAYMLSTKEDHIAPWKSTYRATQIFGGPMRFVLADSGHVAGVINPPSKQKYCYWESSNEHPANPDAWFEGATQHPGSWWMDWANWHQRFEGEMIPAVFKETALEPAPGHYVKERV